MKKELIKKYYSTLPTPFFLYDERKIGDDFLKFEHSLPKNFRIFYSVKANPNIRVLKIFKELGAGAEISSGGELTQVLKAGFKPEMIIFTGPGKTVEELNFALRERIYLIIAESSNEIERIEKIAHKLGIKQNLLLRVNPSFVVQSSDSMFSMAGGGQKFGIDEEKIPEIIARFKKFKHIDLLGLHLFMGSNIFDEKLIVNNTEHLFKLTKFIESKFKINLPIVDIGGGLAVNYSTDAKFNVKNLCRGLTSLIKKHKFENRKILLESGRFLIGEAGEYIAEVVDKKVSRGEKFVIINGGVNHISRATLSKLNHEVEVINRRKSASGGMVNLVGNLNTPTDFITKTRLPKVEIGDLVSIKKVGAYGLTSGMIIFSSHPMAKEYLLSKKGKLDLIG